MYPLPCSDTDFISETSFFRTVSGITVVMWEGPRVLYVTSPSYPFYFRVSTKFGLTPTLLLQSGLTRVSWASRGSTGRRAFGWGEVEDWRDWRTLDTLTVTGAPQNGPRVQAPRGPVPCPPSLLRSQGLSAWKSPLQR